MVRKAVGKPKVMFLESSALIKLCRHSERGHKVVKYIIEKHPSDIILKTSEMAIGEVFKKIGTLF